MATHITCMVTCLSLYGSYGLNNVVSGLKLLNVGSWKTLSRVPNLESLADTKKPSKVKLMKKSSSASLM